MPTNDYSQCSNSSGQLKSSAIFLVMALICQCISMGTNFWSTTPTSLGYQQRYGLWQYCTCFLEGPMFGSSDTKCYCSNIADFAIRDWFKAVRAFEVIGLVLLFFLCIVIVQQLCFNNGQCCKKFGLLLSSFAGMSILLGATIYGMKNYFPLNFSFALCIVAGILSLLCTFLLVADRKQALRRSTESHNQQGTPYIPQGQALSIVDNSTTQIAGYPVPSAPAQFTPQQSARAHFDPPPSYESLTHENQNSQVTFNNAPPSYADIQFKG